MATEFVLPDLGEGVEKATVVQWFVGPGDTLTTDQPVVEVEMDKANIEVPSSVDGKVVEMLASEGDTVEVGAPLFTYEAAEGGAEAEGEPAAAGEAEPETQPADVSAPPAPEPTDEEADAAERHVADAMDAGAAPRRDASSATPPQQPGVRDEQTSPVPDTGTAPGEKPATPDQPQAAAQALAGAAEPAAGEPVFASPSVRRFAREIGVDIHEVKGSGPAGRISEDDVKRFSRRQPAPAAQPSGGGAPAASTELPDFEQWGSVRVEKMSGVRRLTAQAMARSWSQAPHVTIFDKIDITELEAIRNRYKAKAEAKGGKLTVTVLMLKLCAAALKAFPQINASIDVPGERVIYKDYYHIGVAADTDRGLVVPVFRNVDQKNLVQLAVELGELAGKARDGKLTPQEMQGGTFTITNLGAIGVDYFTPIINWPEVAILGMGRAKQEPVLVDGEFVPRLMMPLSLSIDHRLVDGADGARFVGWIKQAIEDPLMLLLEG